MYDLAWPVVGLVFVILANIRLQQWLQMKQPLADKQYSELTDKIAKLQKEVSSLSISIGMRNS